MIFDILNTYSDAQALTATAASTNIIDHGSDRNMGIGTPLSVLVVVDVALDNTTTDETYTVTVQTDDNASFSSPTTVVAATTLAAGSAAGTKFVIAIPQNSVFERYSRLSYTLGGTTPTGTVTAMLVPSEFIQNEVYYPRGYTVA